LPFTVVLFVHIRNLAATPPLHEHKFISHFPVPAFTWYPLSHVAQPLVPACEHMVPVRPMPWVHLHTRSLHLLLSRSYPLEQFMHMCAVCVVHLTSPLWAAGVPSEHTHLLATHDAEPAPSRYPPLHFDTLVLLAALQDSVESAALFATSVQTLHPSVLNLLADTCSFGPPFTVKYPTLHLHALSPGPPVPSLLTGHGTGWHFPLLSAAYPLSQTHADALELGLPVTVWVLAGQAVHWVPFTLLLRPSPKLLVSQEHCTVLSVRSWQKWPSPAQSFEVDPQPVLR